MGFLFDLIADFLILEVWDRLERLLPKWAKIGCWTILVGCFVALIVWLVLK